MLLIAPGDAVATPCSRQSLQCTADADFTAIAEHDDAQPLPAPCFEDSTTGRKLFTCLVIISLAVVAQQFGWAA